MSDSNEVGGSSAINQSLDRPTSRSKYLQDPALDLSTVDQEAPLYQVDKEVYVKGTRGVDPTPYKIHKVLGDGQYELSRDGNVVLSEDGKPPVVFLEEKLQTEP